MKITTKISIGIVFISLIGFGSFVQYAKTTGIEMMGKLSKDQNEMYSTLVNAYIAHSMLEHANEDSLTHLVAVFDEVFGAADLDRRKGSLFLMDTLGQVKINLTDNQNFKSLSKEEVALIRSSIDSNETFAVENFDTKFSIFRIENQAVCKTCHEDSGPTRGYIGLSLEEEEYLGFAAGHSVKNQIWVALIIVLITLSLMSVTYFVVIRPLHRLEGQIQLITSQIESKADSWNMLEQIKVGENKDEVASLGNSFNIMLNSLNTSRKKLKEAHDQTLMRADQLVSTAEMAASLAHEIKNPLAGVMGALEVIYKKTDKGDQYKETLAEINRQLFRINHTLDDLLVFARPSKPSFKPLDLNQVIQSTLNMLKAQPAAKQIEFEFQPGAEVNMINGDNKQISQVFWNILNNATQAMPDGGSLSVTTDRSADYIEVVAEDTGGGITKEDMESIFDSFFTTKSKGTGLGLAVTKQILDIHQASINIESEPGKGTRVSLTFLPMA